MGMKPSSTAKPSNQRLNTRADRTGPLVFIFGRGARRVIAGLLLACAGVMIGACERSPKLGEVRPSNFTAPNAKPDATYRVRGKVTELPIVGKPSSELRVHHEAIDDFKDDQGKVVGMSAMVMEFPPLKGVDVSQLKVGDKVEIEFSVWWTQLPPWAATKITVLPPETELEFRRARPLP
jgi:hypothetical protein